MVGAVTGCVCEDASLLTGGVSLKPRHGWVEGEGQLPDISSGVK